LNRGCNFLLLAVLRCGHAKCLPAAILEIVKYWSRFRLLYARLQQTSRHFTFNWGTGEVAEV